MLVELMFGGLIMDFPLSIQWFQMGLKGYLWTNPINGYKKHKTAGVSFAFRSRAMKWEIMLRHSTCLSWTGCKDLITMIKEPHAWLNFSTELKEIKKISKTISSIQDILHPSKAKCNFKFFT